MALRIRKTMKIKGMTCGQCEKIIHRKLMKVAGVSEAEASFKTNTLQITYDSEKASEAQIHEALHSAGYEVVAEDGPGRH